MEYFGPGTNKIISTVETWIRKDKPQLYEKNKLKVMLTTTVLREMKTKISDNNRHNMAYGGMCKDCLSVGQLQINVHCIAF